MEENAARADESGDESNRALLPLLQPPAALSHRITNFYIDNILRPDFGRKRKDGTLFGDEDSLGVILRRDELRGGGKAAKPGAEADDSGSSDDQQPDCESRDAGSEGGPRATAATPAKPMLWPAWVYCTRYSDRPSSGPRSRKPKKAATPNKEDKRPRTAFTAEQLHRLKTEFQNNRYLTEQRRQTLARELGLNESQIKIWFQNKRAKIKKATGGKNSLALHLMAQGLYNHSASKDAKSDSD